MGGGRQAARQRGTAGNSWAGISPHRRARAMRVPVPPPLAEAAYTQALQDLNEQLSFARFKIKTVKSPVRAQRAVRTRACARCPYVARCTTAACPRAAAGQWHEVRGVCEHGASPPCVHAARTGAVCSACVHVCALRVHATRPHAPPRARTACSQHVDDASKHGSRFSPAQRDLFKQSVRLALAACGARRSLAPCRTHGQPCSTRARRWLCSCCYQGTRARAQMECIAQPSFMDGMVKG